jgi:hypothetical protein
MTLKDLSFRKHSTTSATADEVAAAEAKIGVRFPPALIEFCSKWNGGFPGSANCFYPVPSSFVEFHQEYKSAGVLVEKLFGIAETFPQCSLLKKRDLYTNLGIIPISSDLFGNQVVLRMRAPMGSVYWRDKDLWEVPENAGSGPHFAERPRLIPIAPDLESFYNSLTAEPS